MKKLVVCCQTGNQEEVDLDAGEIEKIEQARERHTQELEAIPPTAEERIEILEQQLAGLLNQA